MRSWTKMTIFSRLGKGIKTTFGIRDLTPQQKVEQQKKQEEQKAYKEIISARQKQAWQMAYQQELARQRQLYGKQREKEAIARGMTKAQQEVQAMGQPKERFGWLTAPARALQKIMPAPPSKVQKQLDFSLGNLTEQGTAVWGTSTPSKQKKLKPFNPMWDIPMEKPTGKLKLKLKSKTPSQSSKLNDMFWKM